MALNPSGFDLNEAVQYHYDQFPPKNVDWGKLLKPISQASASLARYDQMLKGMHNNEILLAPLRSQEAVISSRMEGTISTLEEVLRYEADQEDNSESANQNYRLEAVEVYLYSRAMRMAQNSIKDGAPISSFLMRSTHKILLGYGRGAAMSPGEFKTEQNYLADKVRRKIMFIPISPERLNDGMENLFKFMDDDGWEILIRTALAHLEFEALHPFKDGNGRIGRMIIPLMLWKANALSQPYFYVSEYFEQRRDEYIDRMREVSSHGKWTEWLLFFLEGMENQAQQNLEKAEKIRSLYEEMKERFRDTLSSRWNITALDFIFTRPIFRNNMFTSRSGIPAPTAHKFSRSLLDAGLLNVLEPASGRRAALYSFEPLLELVRA